MFNCGLKWEKNAFCVFLPFCLPCTEQRVLNGEELILKGKMAHLSCGRVALYKGELVINSLIGLAVSKLTQYFSVEKK